MRDGLIEQTPHVRAFDANAEHDSRHPIATEQIDFRLSRPGDMNMGWLVIEGIDDETEAMRAMNDNHGAI